MKWTTTCLLVAACCASVRAETMGPASKRPNPATRVMGLCLWTQDPMLPGAPKSGAKLESLFSGDSVGHALQKIDCLPQPTTNQLTRKALYELLDAIPFLDENATCVFYYLGHGVLLRRNDSILDKAWEGDSFKPVDTDDTFEQCLALDNDNEDEKFVPRSVVRRKLAAKNAGLVVFITDCCSEPFRHADSQLIILGPEKRNQVYEDLFLNSRGFVEINSSSYTTERIKGKELLADFQLAACPADGAIFSNAFHEMFFSSDDLGLDHNKDKFIAWNEVYRHLLGEVARRFALKALELGQTRKLFGGKETNEVWLLQKTQSPVFFGILLDYSNPSK